jgi:adenine-specific DNA-methyltransferase
MELKELNKRYETAIETFTTKTQSNAIFEEIIADAILNYKVDLAKIKEMEEFLKHASKEDTQKLLLSLLDPNFGYLNYSEMNDVTYLIPESERKINKDFYEKGGI